MRKHCWSAFLHEAVAVWQMWWPICWWSRSQDCTSRCHHKNQFAGCDRVGALLSLHHTSRTFRWSSRLAGKQMMLLEAVHGQKRSWRHLWTTQTLLVCCFFLPFPDPNNLQFVGWSRFFQGSSVVYQKRLNKAVKSNNLPKQKVFDRSCKGAGDCWCLLLSYHCSCETLWNLFENLDHVFLLSWPCLWFLPPSLHSFAVLFLPGYLLLPTALWQPFFHSQQVHRKAC